MNFATRFVAMLAVSTLVRGAFAQDKPAKPAEPPKADKKPEAGSQVDNPEYKHWSGFKPGSFSKLKTTGEMMGTKTESMTTMTLKEVTADNAVIEIVSVTKMGDQEMKAPPMTHKVPAKVSMADADKYNNPEGKLKDGQEEIEAAGKKWKTRWMEVETTAGEMKVKSKTWISEDVPGRVVKMTSESAGQMAMKTTGELVEVKADKK